MSRARERLTLLAALPRRYRKEPAALPTLELQNTSTGAITITVGDQLVTVVAGPTTFQQYLGARPPDGDVAIGVAATVTELQAWLATVGLPATLLDATAGSVNPATLLEDGPITVAPLATHEMLRWSEPVWRLFDPAAGALVAAGRRIGIGLAQLNLLTAAADFADFWGTLTATVRRPSETDEAFTARQLHELLRPRENNEALAALLEEEHGVPVREVRDLWRDVFRCSMTPLAGYPLAGRRFNASTAEVVFAGMPPVGALETAEANVAAGITVLLRGELSLGDRETPYYLASSPYLIGAPPAMKIGHPDGTIGIGKIGPP